MALLSYKTEPVGNESLEKWEFVGSGGFGKVYKARHKDWEFDVAIKILRDGICCETAVYEEANHMEKASCGFVLMVYGMYQGCPPVGGSSQQKGIVMEFMGRGSVMSLLEDLCGPPPWPLVFRLAHQVALGMNFLHSRNLMHHDLKPSNVMLNDDLHAKLADFGLCRVSASASNQNSETTRRTGGSFKYMPPEAFETSYEPVRAFDSYSYGILLWSILTGKEPYPAADYDLVALRIPLGDRPPSEEIDQRKAEGLKELVDLMRRCWDKDPSKRPPFKGRHLLCNIELIDPVSVLTKRMNVAEKAKFIDEKRAELIQVVSEVMAITEELGEMVHGETYSVIEAKPTSAEKMRALYQRTLRSGGEKVKAAFFDALKKHHPTIVERLGG
ncbi:ankyrin repeat and protein kinase domain-containing protein 1 [Tautogolabrus adspersus]